MINFYFSDTDPFIEKDIDRDTNDEEEEEDAKSKD